MSSLVEHREGGTPVLRSLLLGLYLVEHMLLLAHPEALLTAGVVDPPRIKEIKPQDSPRGFLPEASELSQVLNDLDLDAAERSPGGTGGVYFIPDRTHSSKVVFKPVAEENDTTGGEGYLKEYAAFVLDGGLAGVPETTISLLEVHGKGPQLGSVQAYVTESEDAEDFGPGVFATEDVHRIGVLDVRLLNCDRHSGNLMRNKRTGKLVPIDHGSSFPCAFSGKLADVSFEWLQYPQAKQPFDPALLEAIEAIDVNEDLERLHLVGLADGAILSTWMSTTILKMAARKGKTLAQIGALLQREGDRSRPSALEIIFARAVDACAGSEEADFFEVFTDLADKLTSTTG